MTADDIEMLARLDNLKHPDALTPAEAQAVAFEIYGQLRALLPQATAYGAGPDIRRLLHAFAEAYDRGVGTP